MPRVESLVRHPVKSLLGESVDSLEFAATGVVGDRVAALVDEESGYVASAKQPRLWRGLLQCRARVDGEGIEVLLPDGSRYAVDDAAAPLGALVGRRVRMSRVLPEGANVERPDPEDVMAQGEEAEVPAAMLELGQGSRAGSFVDWGPVHVVTTATLERLGQEAIRYRPNVVVATDPGTPPFTENDWVGQEVHIGPVVLRGLIPTPRCAVPTLAHGELPRDNSAVRRVLDENRVDVPGFGVLPSVGAYLEILRPGVVSVGDEVVLPSPTRAAQAEGGAPVA